LALTQKCHFFLTSLRFQSLLQKKASFESGPKILMGETAEKIFKIGYGCGEMTLFVIHGRKIARILRKFREGFRAHSRFERNSGGVLGELWESSGRALAELWESSRRVLGEPADSCCCRKCPEPNWECMAQRSCGFFPRIFRPWRPKSVISPHPYPILNIFSAVSPIEIFGGD